MIIHHNVRLKVLKKKLNIKIKIDSYAILNSFLIV